MNLRAALALEPDVIDGTELQLGEKYIIVGSELAQPAALECMDFGKRTVAGLEQRRVPGCRRQRRDDRWPGGNLAGDCPARELDASRVNRAVVFHGDQDGRR